MTGNIYIASNGTIQELGQGWKTRPPSMTEDEMVDFAKAHWPEKHQRLLAEALRYAEIMAWAQTLEPNTSILPRPDALRPEDV